MAVERVRWERLLLRGCTFIHDNRMLAERAFYCFIDNEDLYFPKTDPIYIYATPRTHEEVKTLFSIRLKRMKILFFHL